MPARDEFLEPTQPEEGAKSSWAAITAAAHKKQALPRKSVESTPHDSGFYGSPIQTRNADVATPVAAGALSTRLQALEISSRAGIEARNSSPEHGMKYGTGETSPVGCENVTLQKRARPVADAPAPVVDDAAEWETLPVEKEWTEVKSRRPWADQEAERHRLEEIKARRKENKARQKAEKAAKKANTPAEPVDAGAEKRAKRQTRKRIKKAADKARAAERAEESENVEVEDPAKPELAEMAVSDDEDKFHDAEQRFDSEDCSLHAGAAERVKETDRPEALEQKGMWERVRTFFPWL